MYTVQIIWENGRIDNVTATTKFLMKRILDGVLLRFVGCNEISVYKDNDKENAKFFVLRGKITKSADNIYKTLLELDNE